MNRLYVASLDRVYRLDVKRKVVVAGTGTRGHTGDGGPATAAQLAGATGIDVDPDERIAIAEYDNWIRVVEADGAIRTVAGNGGTGRDGDGGPATAALLGHPHDVVWRRDGLVIADSHNGVLRRVDAAGTITTFAEVGIPIDVAGAPGDALYVTDARGWLARVAPDGAVTRLAFLATPIGVAGDYNGNVSSRSSTRGASCECHRPAGSRFSCRAAGPRSGHRRPTSPEPTSLGASPSTAWVFAVSRLTSSCGSSDPNAATSFSPQSAATPATCGVAMLVPLS